MTPGALRPQIEALLAERLRPLALEVIDDSDRHAGHKGHAGSGNSHFRVAIVSAAFEGKPLLQRHRMVYHALQEHMKLSVHALAITARAPSEVPDAEK